MMTVFVWWAISAVVLLACAAAVGQAKKGNLLGILIDGRERMSLSQFQLVLWTIVVLSLLGGVFFARLLGGVAASMSVTIPNELLAAIGISVGSAASSTAVKASKDLRAAAARAANVSSPVRIRVGNPSFWQLFLTEEGAVETIDISRFQNFWLTVIIVISYIVMAANQIAGTTELAKLTTLPPFDVSQVYFLGISHTGYLAGKLPDRQ